MGNVNIDHVSKRFADELAVDDVSIDVEDGEFVTLVGPSGSGKSTTLEMVAGLTKPSEGEVWIDGNEVTNEPPKDRDIAMVFQNIALFPHMDVYDNISFGLRLRDYEKDDIDDRVEEAANILQIGELLDRMPDELSGGQRQRVAIGRAIVRKPAVFLMDEPLANLDAKLRTHMRTELQRLHKQLDTTIIYVTHDQAEAMTMSNRIAVLDKGQLQQIAPPLTCYNEPANTFVAGFIGSPAMNQFDGTLTANGLETQHFALEFDPAQIQGAATGYEIVVGIRPEDVYRSGGESTPAWASRPIPTRVDVREPMGDEIFVYLRFEEQSSEPVNREDGTATDQSDRSTASGGADLDEQLLMSMEPDADVESERFDVVFDLSKVHLFDAESGDALIHGIAELRDETTAAHSTETDA